MRILVFSVTYDPFVGGAEVALREIAERLPHHSFDIITLRFDSKLPVHEERGNIRIHRVGFASKLSSPADIYKFPYSINKYLFPFLAVSKAAQLHRKNPFSLSWSIMASYAGFAALFFKRSHRDIPYLLTLQEGDPFLENKKIRLAFPAFRQIFLSADTIHAISSYLSQFAASMDYGGPIEIVPNGVDIALFARDYPTADLESLRHSLWGLAPTLDQADMDLGGGVSLVTTSRLVKKNAIGDIIKAMELLSPKTRLIIIGAGPDMIRLRELTLTSKLSERITFLGPVPHAEIPKYLKISDIFIRPSLSEGFGNSFIEAMAAGLPVIATPVGGIIDFVFDPVRNPEREPTGFFCDPGNPESIAEKVKIILESPELTARVVANAQKMAREEYDWGTIARRMDEVFDKTAK